MSIDSRMINVDLYINEPDSSKLGTRPEWKKVREVKVAIGRLTSSKSLLIDQQGTINVYSGLTYDFNIPEKSQLRRGSLIYEVRTVNPSKKYNKLELRRVF